MGSKCISKVINCDQKTFQALSNEDYLNKIKELNDFQKDILSFSNKLELQIKSQLSEKFSGHETFHTNQSKEADGIQTQKSKYHSGKPKSVDRIHFNDLSVERFLNEYV